MDTRKIEGNDENPLDPSFQNGQSDAEKLMRRHLQEPDHVITDEDLKNIEIKSSITSPTPLHPETYEELKESNKDETDHTGPDRIITPLNVLGG